MFLRRCSVSIFALVLTSCTTLNCEEASPPSSHEGAVASQSAAGTSMPDGADIVTAYFAGERRLRTDDGRNWMIGQRPGECAPLPKERPPGFHINYEQVVHGDVIGRVIPVRYAVGGDECEVFWSLLHVGSPSVVCSHYAPAPLDQLYAKLRSLEPHTIKTRQIDDPYKPIHRGGFDVTWHWPGHMCEISDSRDSEVVEAYVERFEELVSWLKAACVTYGHDKCAGIP